MEPLVERIEIVRYRKEIRYANAFVCFDPTGLPKLLLKKLAHLICPY